MKKEYKQRKSTREVIDIEIVAQRRNINSDSFKEKKLKYEQFNGEVI